MENFTTVIKHVHLLPLLLLPFCYNTHTRAHTQTGTYTNTLTHQPSLSYFTNTLCIKMKGVNGNVFCKQNGLLFPSLIRCLSIQHHHRILGRDKPDFSFKMFVCLFVGWFVCLFWGGYSHGTRLLWPRILLLSRPSCVWKLQKCLESLIDWNKRDASFYPSVLPSTTVSS